MKFENEIINNYRIIKKIGSGSFGTIYLAENNSNKVAIKVESIMTKEPQLRNEYNSYRLLTDNVPNIHWFGYEHEHRILIMDLIGPSLETAYSGNRDSFTFNTIIRLGIKMFDIIESVHNKLVIHRDIKPDNFLIDKNGKLYIIDFGLSRIYRNNEVHIPYITNKKIVGTPRYISLNVHKGIEPSRRDDIESIFYMLIFFQNGSLPWQGLGKCDKKYTKILNKKIETTTQDLCKGFPKQFLLLINYIRELTFEETPNYSYMKGLLYECIN